MPRKMHHSMGRKAQRSRNPKILLKQAITYLRRVNEGARPTQKAGPKWTVTVEFVRSTRLIPGASHGVASARDEACELVCVKTRSGTRVTGRLPPQLVSPLFSASNSQADNERMAKEYFGSLKRLGQVILVEVFPEYVAEPAKKPAQTVVAEPEAPTAPETDAGPLTMDELRAQHEAQECWDDSEEEEEEEEEAVLTMDELRAQHEVTECWDDSEDDEDVTEPEVSAEPGARQGGSDANLGPLHAASQDMVRELVELRYRNGIPSCWDESADEDEQDEEEEAEMVEEEDWEGTLRESKSVALLPALQKRASVKPGRFEEETFLPGANNKHTSGRDIDPGHGTWQEPFLPPDWAEGKTPEEQAEIDALRWEMWVESPTSDDEDE